MSNVLKIGNELFDTSVTGKISAATEAQKTAWNNSTADETATTADAEYTANTASKSNAVDNLDLIFTNDATAQAFLNNVDKALEEVTGRKTSIGAAQQRVTSAMEVTKVMSNNLTSAKSLIEDADIAKESSNYIKNQILQQTASSLLATANQNPSIALSLI